MNVLVVPDKFKGTLTASQAAEAIARGWRSVRPGDQLELLPMSDGGDGFGEIMSQLFGAAPKVTSTIDAAHRRCDATWWLDEQTGTAIIESARIIGLAQLPGGFHPFDLDTHGLGIVLKDAASAGARRCMVGIGGSATNDGGFGMARELGWTFSDERGGKLERWTDLDQLASIARPQQPKLFDELIVAVDVQNPLLGPEGCSRVYGPQKGLQPKNIPVAERHLEQLATVLKQQLSLDFADTPGAGAAGGLGFGLLSFAGARLVGGFELFAEQARLAERMKHCDLVITAEGAIDRQTLMGKGVGQIAKLCRNSGIPCIAMAGVVQKREDAQTLFAQTHALTDITSTEEAMTRADHWLERLAARAAEQR
jgi:glycerate kinase